MIPTSTARGFTDYEHFDSVGLIHMNGRVYDPELGRFMSADPFVQALYNSQSYNRYSYVFNNPLSFTDPSGYTSGIYKDYGVRRGDEDTDTVDVLGNCPSGVTCLTGDAAYQLGQDWQSYTSRMVNQSINDAINQAINHANMNEAIAKLELQARHQAVLGLDNSETLDKLKSLTLDDVAALSGGS